MKFRISPLSYFIMTASALYPFHLAQAANTAMTGGANLSTSGTGSSYSRGSHGSVVFAGDDDYCGADNVIGRRGVTSATGGAISAYEQFQRFMNNTAFGSYHPYGTSTSQVVWTGDGTTSGNIGYQGALTGGATSELPTAYGVYSFATGCGSYATGNYSTAFGSNATATGAAAQAFGVSALASGTASVAMGVGAEATADSAVAIGPVSAAKGVNSVALGMGAVANKDDDIALGSESETSDVVATATSQINGQQYNYAGSAPKSAVSVGSVGKERQLQNVAAGQLSATSTDGVNGSQLFATNSALDQVGANLSAAVDSLGGGAAIGTDGQFTAPEYQIQGAARGTVGDALTALDASVTSNTSNISNLQNDISSGSVGLVRQDATSKAITVAAASGGTSVDFSGSDGVRTLSGIRDGKVAADSSEAVTGSQLFATRQAVETNTADIATNTADIATNKADIATNTSDIAASKSDIATNTAAIGANTSAIASQGQTLSQHDGQLSGLTTALGGGAGIGTDGQFTAPEYQIQGAARGTVGDALTALDSSVTRNTSNISNLQNDISSGSVGLVRQDATSKAITVAAASGGTSVDFSGSDGARTLSGIRDGKVAADSSEAVTGSQLFATRQAVETNTADIATNTADIATNKADIATNTSDIAASKNDIATNTAAIGVNTSAIASQGQTLSQHDGQLSGLTTALGGGAGIGTDGQFTAPEYQIQGAARGTVGDALTALDTSVTSNTSNISNLQSDISSGSVGLVRQDATNKAITVAAASGGTSVDFSGSDGVRTLSGIRDGNVAADSSEAVTGSQLFATRQAVETNTADIATNTADIATNTSDIAASKDDIATNTAAIGANTSAIASQGQTLSQHDGQLSGLTTALGGGAGIGTDGQFTAPEYQIQGAARGTVGDALTALDTSVTSNTSNISNLQNDISSGSVGLVRQDATSKAITVAAASGGTSVDFSGSDGARTLSGIRDGKVAADSSEAVTGSQLFLTNTTLSRTAEALGGGARVIAGSQFIAPSYRVQGELKHNVGDALSTLDGAVTWNTSAINSLAAGGSGLVQIASAGSKITIGAASSANTIDVRGTGGARVLSGVAKGEVSANSKDAVNGSQLYATNQQVQKNTNDISHLSNSVQDVIEGKTGLVQQSDPEGSVDIAKNSGGDRVSVSGTSGDRRLSGVSNGVADNDAATVGQLRDITGKLGDSSMLAVNSDKANRPQATGKDAIAIGAGASASNANGVAVGSQSTSSGEHSIAIGDNSRSEGSHALALGSGSKATAKNAVALGSGSVAKEENTVSVGDVGHERRITNVGRGVNASDAATVGQMNDGFASLQNYTNRQVDHLNKRIGDVQDKLTAGIASAMALSGIPQAYQPDSSLVGVAGGSYGGASAIAVGVSHISENGHWITKLQASGNSQSDFGGSVGVGYQW